MEAPARPLVGVAPLRLTDAGGGTLLTVRPRYAQALLQAGAVPVMMAGVEPGSARSFVAGVSGVVLPGGRDVPPALYGERPDPELEETLEDDLALTYIEVARAALELGVPFLGICLGLQVMNVALGGKLVQHMRPGPDTGARRVLHRGPGQTDVRHEVTLKPGSRLHGALGRDRVDTVSHHHQSASELGRGLDAVGWADDGCIEALEAPRHRFFVGVQWHPERSLEDDASLRLFGSFVVEARAFAMDRLAVRS